MKLLLLVALIVLLLVAYASTRPDRFRIERSTRIQASPERVFALINDFRQWALWSPWENKDPHMQRTLQGPTSGIGAKYAWQGNKDVGSGAMEILDAQPNSLVRVKLDFFKPFEAHNTVEFTLSEHSGQTQITWAMYGPQPFLAKLMGLFFNMEKMVGPDFEQGLNALKGLAEQ